MSVISFDGLQSRGCPEVLLRMSGVGWGVSGVCFDEAGGFSASGGQRCRGATVSRVAVLIHFVYGCVVLHGVVSSIRFWFGLRWLF